MRPLVSIKQYCRYCMNNQKREVFLCPDSACFFYPFRFGKKQPSNLTPIKAIKQKCLDCSGFSKKELRLCQHYQCFLWLYRLGKNPKRKKPTTRQYQPMAKGLCIQNC